MGGGRLDEFSWNRFFFFRLFPIDRNGRIHHQLDEHQIVFFPFTLLGLFGFYFMLDCRNWLCRCTLHAVRIYWISVNFTVSQDVSEWVAMPPSVVHVLCAVVVPSDRIESLVRNFMQIHVECIYIENRIERCRTEYVYSTVSRRSFSLLTPTHTHIQKEHQATN